MSILYLNSITFPLLHPILLSVMQMQTQSYNIATVGTTYTDCYQVP